jgi:site-specific DNA-cytosine methylase
VAARIPFGVEQPQAAPQTVAHAIADLRGLRRASDLAETQQYVIEGHNPVAALRRADGVVDGHTWQLSRSNDAWLTAWDSWPEGWLAKKLYEEGGADVRRTLEEAHTAAGLLPRWRPERPTWFGGPARLAAGKQCRTLTGSAGAEIFHYSEPRPLSVRECGRLMGMPDEWSYKAARSVGQAYSWIGKSLPLQPAEWIARCALASLRGEPGELRGTEVGEDEWEVNV